MSQDDAPPRPPLDHLAEYVPRHFEPYGLVGELTLVHVSQVGRVLQVVFDGVPETRAGRFGVRILTPEKVGDERWFEFPADLDEPAEEWVKMAVILELMEVYDTAAPNSEVLSDADGIIWLR